MRLLLRGAVHGAPAADSLLVEGDVITWVGRGKPPRPADEEVVAAPGEVIAPGFIDLQVNGFGGHDVAAGAEAIAAVSEALPSTGVTAFLPTLISAPVEVGAAFTAAVGAAAEAQGSRVLGAHVEGPFLNPSFRGAHLRSHLAEPTVDNVDAVRDARLLPVTLDPRVITGLIADGEHVHPAMCEQRIRVKGASRIALTTDQTSAAGAPPGSYSLSGRSVVSDGRVVRLEDGTLAGSAATMPDLVRLMARTAGVGPSRAITLASAVPARVLGERRLGRITAGACADLVVLDADLRVRLT